MSETIRRRILGGITIFLLVVAVVLHLGGHWGLFGPAVQKLWGQSLWGQSLWGMSLKAGLTFGVAWLAFPQLMAVANRCSPRLAFGMLAGLGIVLVRKQTFPVVATLLLALAILEWLGGLPQPRKPRR